MTSSDANLCMVVVAIQMNSSIIMIAGIMSRYLRTFKIRLAIRDTAIKLMARVMAMVILLVARITVRVIMLGARLMLGSQIIVPVANIYLEDVLVELAVTMLIPMSFAGRNDKNDPAFPDDEDVFAQSMEQASNNGFVPGRRRETGPSGRTSLGGNGNGTATSHNGTAWRSGRASHNPATRGETPRDTPHYTGTSHAGLSNVGTASRRGAALHGGQGTRDRMQEGKTPHGSSNARASRRGDAPTNVVSRRSVASHSDRGSLDKTTPGEGPYDTPSNPGARISSMAFADSTFRATIHTQSLRETPIGTAEGALPAKKTSLATTAAHRADEPRNNKPQGATFTNPAARPTVVAPANTTSQTAAAAHEIQQRMESMALGAATADPSPRTANTAHGVQGLPHSKAQGGLAQAYGGKATQAGPSRPQASRNGGLKSVRFQTGTPKPEAGVSDDY